MPFSAMLKRCWLIQHITGKKQRKEEKELTSDSNPLILSSATLTEWKKSKANKRKHKEGEDFASSRCAMHECIQTTFQFHPRGQGGRDGMKVNMLQKPGACKLNVKEPVKD